MAKNLRLATSNEYAEKFEIFAAFKKHNYVVTGKYEPEWLKKVSLTTSG